MIGSAHSRHSEQVHLLERRKLLGFLVIIPAALPCILLSGCEGSIPPRQVKRIPATSSAETVGWPQSKSRR
jgi:hypothetical protein